MSPAVRCPMERCYWAVIDGQGWARSGELPRGLRPVVADELPLELDELHAVVAPLPEGRLLVCAVPAEHLAELGPEVLSLTPEGVPDFAQGARGGLELLIGPHEPGRIRRARSRRRQLIMSAALASIALIHVGLYRRTAAWRADRAALDEAVAAMTQSVAPGIPPEFLGRELAGLRREAGAGAVRPPADVAIAAASILRAWPAQVPSQPQGLTIGPSSISLAVVLQEEPTRFLEAFSPPPGWRLQEPRINTAGESWRVNLAFVPAGARP